MPGNRSSSSSIRTANLQLPHFIPFARQIYPGLTGSCPFEAAADLDPTEDATILHRGYAWLSADAKFGKILQRGENGRISFMGISSPEEGWMAMF